MSRHHMAFLFVLCRVFAVDIPATHRIGPGGSAAMFGKRDNYPDGSIGMEIEARIMIRGPDLRSGISYAVAKTGDDPMWMLQVDGALGDGYRLELVSYVMDASGTSKLLIVEQSLKLFLKQFPAHDTPLTTIVNNYNRVVSRTNADPAWKVMKMPLLDFTNAAAPHDISAENLMPSLDLNRIKLQINFGVRVETFTPSHIDAFLKDRPDVSPGDLSFNLQSQYIFEAVNMADTWVEAFPIKTGATFSADEQGILALTIAKTLAKQSRFGYTYDPSNGFLKGLGRGYGRYKNSLVMLPKVNVRELILLSEPLGRLLSDTEFLSTFQAKEPMLITDIKRLVARRDSPAVDDDCFARADRVFPSQRHDGDRLAVVMETRYKLPPNVKYRDGSVVEVRSSVEAVRSYQILYGDLRAISDLRPFLNFEVTNAIMKMPEFSRVTLDFDDVDTGMIQRVVLPLAEDSQFLLSLRRIVGIHRIDFSGENAFSISRHVLSISVDSINGGAEAASDLRRDLKSHITQNLRRKLEKYVEHLSKLGRKYNVVVSGRIDFCFDMVENFRSEFATALYTKLGTRKIVLGSTEDDFLSKWAIPNGAKKKAIWYETVLAVDESALALAKDDLKRTLEIWIDRELNKNSRAYHPDDDLFQAKLKMLRDEFQTHRVRRQTCTIL